MTVWQTFVEGDGILRRRLFSVAVVAVIVASPAPASLTTQSVKITSSLDGKKVLPLKVRWLAHPRVPTGRISEVDFLIDGKLRCVERYAPYNYGSDDRHGHLGYLVTTWLAPGKHRFTVRVVLATGRKASHTVVARVLPAPKPPGALAGKWYRRVTADPKLVPSGIWTIVFDRIGSWDLDPVGSGVVEHVVIRPSTINIDAPLWMTPEVNGHFKLSRYGHTDIGAFFCREDGPPGSYRWSVASGELRLAALDEPCAARRAVWEGVWTRVAGQ